jgi:predicted enzyme related to lactoylglutathione lyase
MSALRTPDPDAAPAFYEAVFGWQAEPFGPATMWRLPG